jgi:hypothetical protein
MKIPMLLIILALACYGCSSNRLSKLEKPNEKYSSEILASARFSRDERSKALQMIASKKDLSETDQLFLIDVILAQGKFAVGFSIKINNNGVQAGDSPENNKLILLTLIKNEATTDKALDKIADSLHKFRLFPDDKKEILDALIS